MEWIDWASFPGWHERNNPRDPPRQRRNRPLPDGDNIIVFVDRNVFTDKSIDVVLQTQPHVTWWKEIKALAYDGELIASVSTQGANHGPNSMHLQLDIEFPPRILVFSKAKFLGVHTGMYVLSYLTEMVDSRIIFDWWGD
jgi:NADPH:quinone reductase-like Zn-dependent oxidoreductase